MAKRKDFIKALTAGDLKVVKKMIKNDFDVNVVHNYCIRNDKFWPCELDQCGGCRSLTPLHIGSVDFLSHFTSSEVRFLDLVSALKKVPQLFSKIL